MITRPSFRAKNINENVHMSLKISASKRACHSKAACPSQTLSLLRLDQEAFYVHRGKRPLQ